MDYFITPTEIPHALGPLRESHESDDVEAGLKAATMAVFEDMIRPRMQRIGSYGAPHRGDFDAVERFVKADGLALDRQDAREPYMRELFRAWRSNNPRRGLHFLRHYLRLLYPGTSSVYQLWWNPSDPYPVGSTTEIPGGVLTSRVRVTIPGSGAMSNADLIRLRGILASIIPARMVLEIFVTVGAGFESTVSIVGVGNLTEMVSWSGDAAPALAMLSVSDIVVDDTDGSAVFTVTLNSIQSGAVSVNYATSDGTATAPGDYTATSGTLTISPGDLSGTVSVPIVANTSAEGDETFTLTLSAPSGAALGDATAVCTIVDTYVAPSGDPYWANVALLAHFDGSLTDVSAYEHTLAAQGGASAAASGGVFGGALLLASSGDFVAGPTHSALSLETGDWTIELWVKQSSGATAIIVNRAVGAGYYPYQILVNSSGKIQARGFSDASALVWDVQTAEAISADTWYYVAVRRSGSSFELWVDGAIQASATYSGALYSPGPLGFSVGAYDTGSFSLLGRIDDLRVTAGAARDVSIVPTAPFPAGT